MTSYVIWANKGGIGKSTLTFQLACATARERETGQDNLYYRFKPAMRCFKNDPWWWSQ